MTIVIINAKLTGPQMANGNYRVDLLPGGTVTPASNNTDATTADTAADTAVAAKVSVAATEAAVAVLEADGATPTQGHVTSLRSVWNTLSAGCTTLNAAVDANLVAVETIVTDAAALVPPTGTDVTVIYDTTNIVDNFKLRDCLRAIAASRA